MYCTHTLPYSCMEALEIMPEQLSMNGLFNMHHITTTSLDHFTLRHSYCSVLSECTWLFWVWAHETISHLIHFLVCFHRNKTTSVEEDRPSLVLDHDKPGSVMIFSARPPPLSRVAKCH